MMIKTEAPRMDLYVIKALSDQDLPQLTTTSSTEAFLQGCAVSQRSGCLIFVYMIEQSPQWST